MPPARQLTCNRNTGNSACVNAYNSFQNWNLFIDYQYYQNRKPLDLDFSNWLGRYLKFSVFFWLLYYYFSR